MSAPRAKNVLAGLLRAAGHPDATAGAIELPGSAPVLPSSFAVDTAAQATIAAAALAANELWRLRTDRRTLSLRRRALGTASYQSAPSSRRGARPARLQP